MELLFSSAAPHDPRRWPYDNSESRLDLPSCSFLIALFLIVLSVPEICLIPCKLFPRQCRSIFVIGSSPVVPAPPALFPGPLSPRSPLPCSLVLSSLVPAEYNEFRHPLQSHAATRSNFMPPPGATESCHWQSERIRSIIHVEGVRECLSNTN
jgi:hypothetical protein